MDEGESVVRDFIAAYGQDDREQMRRLLAGDVVAFVTNSAGGVDRVEGAAGYLARVPSLDDAELSISVTQSVLVEPACALTMVEIRAVRGGHTLHNFAGFLTRVVEGRMTEIWMVDARPAQSDAFWS